MDATVSIRRTGRISLVLVVVMAGSGTAIAAPTKEQCDGLKAEQAALIASGVPATMERGAEWARANLDVRRLAAIKRFIEVSEQVTFRCEPLRPLNARIEQSETEPKETEVKDGDAADPKPPDVAPVKPKTAPKPKTKTTADANDAPPPAPAKPAAKAVPKPKPNDAFVPPPAAPGVPGGLDAQAIRKTP